MKRKLITRSTKHEIISDIMNEYEQSEQQISKKDIESEKDIALINIGDNPGFLPQTMSNQSKTESPKQEASALEKILLSIYKALYGTD